MNYRHSFHAGNFADVFKHIILVALLQSLSRKDNGFCFLDTHAGVGRYDLDSAAAKKSQEFTLGITKLIAAPKPPRLVSDYLQIVKKINSTTPDELHFYPGSPYIAREFIRPQDRMVLTELHDEDFSALKTIFPHNKQIGMHHQDGYQALKAFLPPKERRGLVLIDPPYEKPDELMQTCDALAAAVERWETGVFALWYPIKETRSIARFHQRLQLKIARPMLAIELSIHEETLATHLNGNGLIIVNPPWQFADEIKQILPWLWQTLSIAKKGRYEIKELFIQ
jgi:23S rRNA (adenine2030-N6)-methyltransferase